LQQRLKCIQWRSFLLYCTKGISNVGNETLKIFEKLSNSYTVLRITEKEDLGIINTISPIIERDTIEHLRECIKKNGRVFLVFDKDRLIFRGCVQRGEYLVPILGDAYIRIPESDFYIEYCQTHPRYRGQRIYPWVLFQIYTELAKYEENTVYIGAYGENLSSQKAIVSAGFEVKESYVLFRVFLITIKIRERIFFGKAHFMRIPLHTSIVKFAQKSVASTFGTLWRP
jgi:hypothetical protein